MKTIAIRLLDMEEVILVNTQKKIEDLKIYRCF